MVGNINQISTFVTNLNIFEQFVISEADLNDQICRVKKIMLDFERSLSGLQGGKRTTGFSYLRAKHSQSDRVR